VQHQTNLIGHRSPARGPIGSELRLVELDPEPMGWMTATIVAE
jgi:hypothetical protein